MRNVMDGASERLISPLPAGTELDDMEEEDQEGAGPCRDRPTGEVRTRGRPLRKTHHPCDTIISFASLICWADFDERRKVVMIAIPLYVDREFIQHTT